MERFATGSIGRRCGVKLFIVSVDRTRGETVWCMASLLPGTKRMFGPFDSEDQGKAAAEFCFRHWLNQLLLTHE